MKVTFIVKNLTDTAHSELSALPDAERFARLCKWAFGDLRHCISQRTGSANQFRDRVELNQIMRSPRFVSYKLEPRKGYKLATFEIERA